MESQLIEPTNQLGLTTSNLLRDHYHKSKHADPDCFTVQLLVSQPGYRTYIFLDSTCSLNLSGFLMTLN